MARPRRRAGDALVLLVLAACAYVPLVRTQPGWVGADTKHYLYLDPVRFMARAASVWDPSVGLGTVSHQNVGYLWPMGPWYAFFEAIGAPDWLAQRLWLATVFFAAGAGAWFLFRLLGLRGLGAAVAALAYQLSPYVLAYAARISAILLPWAGLPWLLAFTVLAMRRKGWRWPATIALLVTTIGSINASSLLYAGVAAALWIPYAVVILREVTWRDAGAAVLRIGVLTGVTQLWWLAALVLSGIHGPPVLKTTETLEAVSASSLTSEVVRSLGNWFFYGRDAVGPWVQAAVDYQTDGWLIAVTFAIPVLALAGAAVSAWAHRAYFLALVVIGGVIAVAAHPYDDPSPLGALTKLAADSSTLALALRNAQRATPLLCLGLAAMLGCGVHAVGRRIDRGDVLAAVGATALVALGLPGLWAHDVVDPNLRRPEVIPEWNTAAAAALGDEGETRVLELPGTDFAAFRWGNTIDPLLPGLIDRPWVGRESAPQGSAGAISLITALDRRLQEGVLEPEALASIARLVSAGDVVVRGDLQTERYRTPRPRVLSDLVTPTPRGLSSPRAFGPSGINVPPPALPLVDELALGVGSDVPELAPITIFGVDGAPPIIHAVDSRAPILLDGDGEGVVEAASAGLLDPRRLVAFGPTVTSRRGRALDRDGATVIVTDTNRRRAQRFTQLRENYGYTEAAGERPLRPDAADARIDLFPEAGDEARTVTVLRGVRSVRATAYGNTITYIPEERPALAIDGDTTTAWRVGAFESPVGHRLRVELERPVELDHLQLLQPLTGDRNRWITRVRVSLDGDAVVDVDLDDSSRAASGQRVDVPRRTASTVELEVLADSAGRRPDYLGLSAVGFAEVRIPGVVAHEWIRPPRTLLDAIDDRELVYLFSRLRANPAEPVRSDPEVQMRRLIESPRDRTFTVSGTARIAATIDDAFVDRLLGLPDATRGGITARSSSRLPGSLASRASSAFDGDPATAWTPAFNASEQWVEVETADHRAIDRLDLQLVVDERHSVPTLLQLQSDSGVRTIVVPDQPAAVDGGRVTIPLRFEPLEGTRFRLVVGETATKTTIDYFSRAPTPLPVAIAEVGLPGTVRAPLPASLPAACRPDLVAVDGRAVPVQLHGAPAEAERRDAIPFTACGPDTSVALPRGEHRLETAQGTSTGIDIDRLVLTSPVARASATAGASSSARVDAKRTSRSTHSVRVSGLSHAQWLVLGESWSAGWEARAGDRSLGEPVLVNGFANGWLVDPEEVGRDVTIELRWAPQRLVDIALLVSAVGIVVSLILLVRRPTSAPRTCDAPAPEWAGAGRRADGSRPQRERALATVLVVGVSGALVASPVHGVLAALLAFAVVAVPRARPLPLAVAVAMTAVCGAGTLLLQVRHGYPPGFTWASNFDRLHPVGWVVFVALLVEVVVEVVMDAGAKGYKADAAEPAPLNER